MNEGSAQRSRFGVGFAAALAGAACCHVYLSRFEQEVAGGEPRSVVMVTSDLALGELITRASLSTRELPERYVEDRHIAAADLERIVGTRATARVSSGSTLLWSDLDLMQDGRTLSALVRTGMRAFSLVGRDVSFEGLLRPGDRVDALLTRQDASVRTLVQNVLVLTVGSDLGADDSTNVHAERTGSVTLSVTPEQGQMLARELEFGKVRLLLRNPSDLVLAQQSQPSEQEAVEGPSDAR